MGSRKIKNPRLLLLIGAFKLFKGFVLIAVGIGALRLLNKNTAAEVHHWVNAFRVDPAHHYIHRLFERLPMINEKMLRQLSVGTFFFAALFLVEGAGLLLRKRWAEYFTIIETSIFIPLEIYELFRRASFAKGIVLLLNVAVVAYLAMNLRRGRS